MNSTIKRVIAAMLAIVMVTLVFASCQKQEDDNEITRSANVIASPDVSTEPTTEPTSAEDPASSEAASDTSAAPQNNSSNTQNNTQTQSNSQANSIASSSGLDAAFVASLINAFGYNYDAKEGVFYTELDSWQRSGNFISQYDTLAAFGNMTYLTTKVDFNYDGLGWRLQFWKGQYGPFGGAEIGVYTKIPGQTDDLYFCADDDHLMYMTFTLYLTATDYYAGNKYFTRGWQKHWWLTGFKTGTVTPTDLVMSARIRTYDSTMAAAMEKGLQSAGFKKGDASKQMDTYRRSGFDYYILWRSVGNVNYNER